MSGHREIGPSIPLHGLLRLLACIALLPATAGAVLVTDPPEGVNEPVFYANLRVALAQLPQSGDPVIRGLHDAAQNAPAPIHFRPMTDDRSTWNADGSRTRAHTEPNDRQPKRLGRSAPAGATVYLPPDAVDPAKSRRSGVLVHELMHAVDLAHGRYAAAAAVRERRAVFVQNLWRSGIGAALRTSYHGRFATLDYQEAVRRGTVDAYARYLFTRSDFPAPPTVAPAGKNAKQLGEGR